MQLVRKTPCCNCNLNKNFVPFLLVNRPRVIGYLGLVLGYGCEGVGGWLDAGGIVLKKKLLMAELILIVTKNTIYPFSVLNFS